MSDEKQVEEAREKRGLGALAKDGLMALLVVLALVYLVGRLTGAIP